MNSCRLIGVETPVLHRYTDSIHVFNGNFTVDADKHKLVDTVLPRLWRDRTVIAP